MFSRCALCGVRRTGRAFGGKGGPSGKDAAPGKSGLPEVYLRIWVRTYCRMPPAR